MHVYILVETVKYEAFRTFRGAWASAQPGVDIINDHAKTALPGSGPDSLELLKVPLGAEIDHEAVEVIMRWPLL